MGRDQIIALLLKHRPEFEAAGVEHMALFGSVARQTHTADSDIDIVLTLSDPVMRSGLGYFGMLDGLKSRLQDITGKNVDVISEPIEKDRLRLQIERDKVVAF